ncbi:MAG: sodium:sulfate symporter, partial [Desulfobacterales bacterium]|nr:sodium:sulfate symporter [Desulfobacterales bacterium]
MTEKTKEKPTGYDKYVDWKFFIIPVVLFFTILVLPTPHGMKDVGTEYRVGPKAVIEHITRTLFGRPSSDVEQWQMICARIMEQNMRMGALSRDRYLKRNHKWCLKYKIPADPKNFVQAHTYMKEKVSDEAFTNLMT